MAKDFGSSEGWVTAEEIFFRGKETAAHEYEYFENAFLYLYGLQVLTFGKLQVLKQRWFRSGINWHLWSKIIFAIKVKHAANQDIVNHVRVSAYTEPQVVSG